MSPNTVKMEFDLEDIVSLRAAVEQALYYCGGDDDEEYYTKLLERLVEQEKILDFQSIED